MPPPPPPPASPLVASSPAGNAAAGGDPAAGANGDALAAKARKLRDGAGNLLTSLFGGTARSREDAEDLFVQAANQYRLARRWGDAGDAFIEAAKLKVLLGEVGDAAARYVDAGNAYKKVAPDAAVKALDAAAKIYADAGRRSMAAKQKSAAAALCRDDLADLERAMGYYLAAADAYADEDSPSAASACSFEAAKAAADLERYPDAIRLFEEVAIASTANSLTKWSAKDYFMHAGVCYLASGDVVGCRRAFERFVAADASFAQQREYAFLSRLMDTVENADADAFGAQCRDFDALTKLDPWKTSHLLRAKKRIESVSLT